MTLLEKKLHDKFKHTKFWSVYKNSKNPSIRRMVLRKFLRDLGLIESYYSTMSFRDFRKTAKYQYLLDARCYPFSRKEI